MSVGGSVWRVTWRRFRRSKLATFAVRWVTVLALIALLAPLIANRKPLLERNADGWATPALADYWASDADLDPPRALATFALRAPIPFSPNTISLRDRLEAPTRLHLLGTDDLGRDVLARMIHGARVSLTVGLLATAIAFLVGSLLGALAGYYGGAADWIVSRLIEVVNAGGTRAVLRVQGKVYVLESDPWSPEAARALMFAAGDAVSALAKPGQLSGLALQRGQAASSTTSGSSEIVRFVDEAIDQAKQFGASDIHFESTRQGIHTKFRVDGVMNMGSSLASTGRAEEVISRIKVMAQLDITERRKPQDGRIHLAAGPWAGLDMRVSVMPSIFGEDAVLRLLDKSQLQLNQSSISLESLQFEEHAAASIRRLASRPHGMLLVTGPTGSGKTTTTYAALSEVNDGLEKIVTIEDPVEYELPGVLQIPVNEQKGLTFATGLRSILRHDPDKILVGEIRDAETAEIAVQSSLTGHLVFTTVHANSLFDVLGRFRHFGLDPFALGSALNGIVVQRLVRRLCPACATTRAAKTADTSLFGQLGLDIPQEMPAHRGCPACRSTGYRGRFVIAEVHEFSEATRDMIARSAPLPELRAALFAGKEHHRLLARALTRVSQGWTTMEEVSRVVGVD